MYQAHGQEGDRPEGHPGQRCARPHKEREPKQGHDKADGEIDVDTVIARATGEGKTEVLAAERT